MSVFEITEEDFAEYDIDWAEPTAEAPKATYVPKVDQMEQARNLYLTELTAMNDAIKGLRGRMPEVVKLAKSNGATWEDIGDALGTSRQAACRTYNELIAL